MTQKFTIDPKQPFFIFDSSGEVHAVKLGYFLYDMRGEYIGYVIRDDYDVYTASGEWIGNIFPDGRIVRKRNTARKPLMTNKPPTQPKIRITARIPLPPMASDLGFDKLDVLEFDPEVFKRISDLMPDKE